jgi:two-component sensor histidine kinase
LVALAAVSTRKGYVEEAILLNLEAIEILESQQDSMQLAQLYFATANLFNGQGDFQRAYEYADKALQTSIDLNLKSTRANALLSRAKPLAKLGKPVQALADLKQALSIYNQRKVGLYVGDCLHEIGWIFIDQMQYDSARFYFDRMMDVANTRKDKDHLYSAYANLGQLAIHENNPTEAINNFNVAKQHVISENFKQRAQIEEGLFKAYNLKGNTSLAMLHLQKQTSLKDSAYSLDKTKLFYDLESKYNRTVQAKEIATLSTENQLSKIQLSNSRRWLYTLVFGFVGIGLLLIRIFQSNRKIKEQNQIITKALDEKDTLLREIHHRVKNNLQFISSLLSLQSDHIENDQALEALKEGQDRVQSMALIHQNLYQDDNLTGIDIRAYFEKLTQNLFDSYNISPDTIKLKMDIQPLNLDVDTVVPLGLIINELVSNALKYAFSDQIASTITVEIKEKDEALTLLVKDDGIGLEESQLGESFGYRLIRAFNDQLDAKLEVDGKDGTTIKMAIKDYRKIA